MFEACLQQLLARVSCTHTHPHRRALSDACKRTRPPTHPPMHPTPPHPRGHLPLCIRAQGSEEFDALVAEACAQQLLADVWLSADMAAVYDSEHFFLFEDVLR